MIIEGISIVSNEKLSKTYERSSTYWFLKSAITNFSLSSIQYVLCKAHQHKNLNRCIWHYWLIEYDNRGISSVRNEEWMKTDEKSLTYNFLSWPSSTCCCWWFPDYAWLTWKRVQNHLMFLLVREFSQQSLEWEIQGF